METFSEADLRKMSYEQLLHHAIEKVRIENRFGESKVPLIELFAPENNTLFGVHGVGNNDL